MSEGKSLTEKFMDVAFSKHTWIHLGLMAIFMTLPMVAAAVPAGTATLGDLVVQSGHMYLGMAKAGLSSLPVGADMVANTIQGQFAANSYAMGSMMPGMEHAAGGVMGGVPMSGAEHVGTTSFTPDQIERFGNDADAFGVNPQQYLDLMNSHGP